MQILQTDRQPRAVEAMTAGSVKPYCEVVFLSAGERTNGMTIDVGDIVRYDKKA